MIFLIHAEEPVRSTGRVCYQFFILLHASRRAMAAPVLLLLITISCPGQVNRHSRAPFSPSSQIRQVHRVSETVLKYRNLFKSTAIIPSLQPSTPRFQGGPGPPWQCTFPLSFLCSVYISFYTFFSAALGWKRKGNPTVTTGRRMALALCEIFRRERENM